jgi:ADP-heptose:LPS heptosyltransferase
VRDNNKTKHKRILLGHLGRRGDCLYATTIARQIKEDFPDSHLTWAISSMCRSVIEGNPYVDEIWELPLKTNEEIVAAWKLFEIEAMKKKSHAEYDEVYLTQVHPGNFQNYDGTSRSSIFRGYLKPITVPVQPVVRLSNKEVENVRRFADLHQLANKGKVILFECASSSGQSFVTPDFAVKVAQNVFKNNTDVYFILSSDIPIQFTDRHIIDGSVLSFKENAELTKYCCLLVGCSSGISWLATSDWAKPLPKIQLLNSFTVMYASMIYDAMYFGLPTDQILEMQDCTPDLVASCIQIVFDNGFAAAKKKYHRDIHLDLNFYFGQLYWELLRKNELGKAMGSLSVTKERFGNHPQLVYFLHNLVFPYAELAWTDLSKDEREQIVNLFSYKRPDGIFLIARKMMSLFKLFKASLRTDTGFISKELIKNILTRFFNA